MKIIMRLLLAVLQLLDISPIGFSLADPELTIHHNNTALHSFTAYHLTNNSLIFHSNETIRAIAILSLTFAGNFTYNNPVSQPTGAIWIANNSPTHFPLADSFLAGHDNYTSPGVTAIADTTNTSTTGARVLSGRLLKLMLAIPQ
ncbi:hypothetical protein B0T14DRAFT_560319 [Immersiella caudata]|uniref:Uncharacterized protein n=1 Tax=Immersiella caudata TaxID=314043 RepID=A0AA40CCQ0_9PEZI|nr:hypothetical protein B0T14DRAFT_560319 [Immersiella caudata]